MQKLISSASIPLGFVSLDSKIQTFNTIGVILAAIGPDISTAKITRIAFLTGRKTKNRSTEDDNK